MSSASTFSFIQGVQSAFKVIAMLQFTAFMYPKSAVVRDGDTFDFIIVGAGTAGCVIANRLTENPNVQVLLVEAGGDPPLESDFSSAALYLRRTRYDWNYTSEYDHIAQQCHQTPYTEMTLGKMLGGTSSLNYLVYSRAHPVDFNSWAQITQDPAWNWENVLPYYVKIENLVEPEGSTYARIANRGTQGYLKITRENSSNLSAYLNAFKEMGLPVVEDYTREQPLGFSNYFVTIADGHRQSSATAYLTPIKDRPNLHVLKETTVLKINIKNYQATGVRVLTNDGRIIDINARKEVIVSAGTFNSPKLLMLSGIGPRRHLESKCIDVLVDLPVGENLQDFSTVLLLHNMNNIKAQLDPIDPRIYPVSTFRGFLALDRYRDYPDYGVENFLINENIFLYFCSYGYRFTHEICDKCYKANRGKTTVLHQIMNVAPKSRGKILLRSSNPMDNPIVHTGLLSHPDDVDSLVRFIRHLNPVLNTTFYKSMNARFLDPKPASCQEFEPDSTEYWQCYARCMSTGMSYYTSTCPMGTVVDGRLRVHGIRGLRVADASVMPTITHANPAGTVILIGEKVSDFIKACYHL